jgi:hypothetical protein
LRFTAFRGRPGRRVFANSFTAFTLTSVAYMFPTLAGLLTRSPAFTQFAIELRLTPTASAACFIGCQSSIAAKL